MSDYLKRLAEEAFYAAVAGAGAALATGDLSKAGLLAALVAGGRAALGVLVKAFGDKDRPSIAK
jgi:hypothetical protein